MDALDPGTTALVVIDLQKGIVASPTEPHDAATVVANAARLARAFRATRSPVLLVHVVREPGTALQPIADEPMPAGVPPPGWAEIVPELGPEPGDVVIAKHNWGAFHGTDLDLRLRRGGIGTIVLAGISTCFGVESTARFAFEYGYQQLFAEDAMAARSRAAHEASLLVFRRMGRVRRTDEILNALG